MRKYTQEEFNQFPVNEYGYKQCPSGDYTLIETFPECCSFGKRCSFGDCCHFGERCKCEFGEFKSMYTAGGFGSEGRTTYFFHMADGGICVRCGCFTGTIDEWESKVKKTHGVTPYAQVYLLIGAAVRAMCQK